MRPPLSIGIFALSMNFIGFIMKDFLVQVKLTLLKQIIITQVSAVLLFFIQIYKTLPDTDDKLTGL